MLYTLIGFLGGIIGGMGMGGGTILIPMLILLCNVDPKIAQSINLLSSIPMSLVALFIHARNKNVMFNLVVPIALFGDLARRLSLANPNLNNPLLGSGVVLIDEIELHMHPSWQRKILPMLRKCFPNIQFIVTTHSPQVLGELDESYNIFSVEKEQDNINYKLMPALVGWDCNYILKCFMGTDNLNLDTQKLIEDIYDLISENKLDESEKLIKTLEMLTDTAHEDAVKARMLIRRGRKKANEKNY